MAASHVGRRGMPFSICAAPLQLATFVKKPQKLNIPKAISQGGRIWHKRKAGGDALAVRTLNGKNDGHGRDI